MTEDALKAAYKAALDSNTTVKGLLLNNPSNPLGTVLDREALSMALSFTHEKNIHLICDEIYSATVFDEPGFVSIAEILAESPDANPDLVHIVYSLSKDLGFPGFRIGILYSYNDAVVCCARKMSSFGLVSTQTQRMLASMLADEEFVGKFLAESAARLGARRDVEDANVS